MARPIPADYSMTMSRRKFVGSAAVGLLSAAALSTSQAARKGKFPLIVSTWPFGKPANDVALKVLLQDGGSLLNAVERGICVAAPHPTNHSLARRRAPTPP